MKKRPFIPMFVCLFLVALLSCQNDFDSDDTNPKSQRKTAGKSDKKKKVLLVGIDGLQFEKINGTATPNLDKLNIKKGFSGGISGTRSEQKTKSGPGWTTILTGVWIDQHGVPDNSTSHTSKVPSVFKYIKQHNRNLETASVATWAPIHDFLRNDLSDIDYPYKGGNDDTAVQRAVSELTNHNPDFLFVHLDEVDVVGHSSGFGASYDAAIRRADSRFGTIMTAVEQRMNTKNEDWLVLVTTDHGRESSGYNHGSQTTSEKVIFIGMNQAGNAAFTTFVNTVPNQGFGGVYGAIPQTALIPTALTHLGVPIRKDWQLTSSSLVGNAGVLALMMKNANTLYWNANGGGSVSIYRNGQFLATTAASAQEYTDTTQPKGVNNYTVVYNGQTASVSTNNANIIACLDWNDTLNNRAYFFKDDASYVRYNKLADKADSGYPKPTNNSAWPGLGAYANNLSAAFKWHNHKAYFFLNDGRYLRYDMNADKVDSGYPVAITNGNWPGLAAYKDKIIAAINWNNSKAYFFLNDGSYLRYSISSDRVDTGYPKPITNSSWPGLGAYAQKISAAVDWNTTYCYFFLNDKTYIKYNKITDKAVSGYPLPVNGSTWPGL